MNTTTTTTATIAPVANSVVVSLLDRTGAAAKTLAVAIKNEVNAAIKAAQAVNGYQASVLAVLRDCPDNATFYVLFGHGKGSKAVPSAVLEQVYAQLPILAVEPSITSEKLLVILAANEVNGRRRESVRAGFQKVKALWDTEMEKCLAFDGETVGAAVSRLGKEKLAAANDTPPAPPAPPAKRAPHHNDNEKGTDEKPVELLKKELETAKAELALAQTKAKTLDGQPATGKIHIPIDATVVAVGEAVLAWFNQDPARAARAKIGETWSKIRHLITV